MATTTIGAEDRVMATAQQIVKSLNTSKDVTDDMILIFSSFDNRLSNISDLISGSDPRALEGFDAAEKAILGWESDAAADPLSFQDSPEEAAHYLAAVDDILRVTQQLSLQADGGGAGAPDGIRDRAESAIQFAMARLEEEFRTILTRSTVPLDADRLYGSIRRVSLSFASHDGDIGDFESFVDADSDGCYHERGASLGDDVCVDLINPEAVVELKEIADRMIRSGYEKECCQVYCTVRREVLDECLWNLGLDKLSIEEVQKIEWRALDEKIKKWIQVAKATVRVLLPGEKRLCDQIFSGLDQVKDASFIEITKGCVLQLLNFGEAVSIGRRSSEKLFRILDMYDAMADALPDLQALFSMESGDFVCSESREVLARLGEAVMGTFSEFENALGGETSRKPVQGGDIHPLTRYVMNYIKLLVVYSESLNTLFKDSNEEALEPLTAVNGDDLQSGNMSPIGLRLVSLISSLESKLADKSQLYEDPAMQSVFLMNNTLYIIQKVKGSELGKILGDQWVRRRRSQVRQHSTAYLRASWSKALSCLKDDGIGGSTSNASKVALKEKFKNFNASFEEIYRIQTGWKVPDPQLREELRISISEKVLPAYRAFLGRFGHHLEGGRHAGKYVKYTLEDLENYLLDLFEGTPGVLHLRRRSG